MGTKELYHRKRKLTIRKTIASSKRVLNLPGKRDMFISWFVMLVFVIAFLTSKTTETNKW
jgi:hypothetical protein